MKSIFLTILLVIFSTESLGKDINAIQVVNEGGEVKEKNSNNLPLCSAQDDCPHNCWGFTKNKYEGEQKDGEFNGYVNVYAANESKPFFSGMLVYGVWGHGTITYDDGSKYIGQTRKNKPDGLGTLNIANGDKYVGYFSDGKLNGQAVVLFKNGSTLAGIFENGEIVDERQIDIASLQKQQETDRQNLMSFINDHKKVRNFTCPDPESRELRIIFNELAEVTLKWKKVAYSARAAGYAGSNAHGILLQDQMELQRKRIELTDKFVKLWQGKQKSFQKKYLDKNEKFTEFKPTHNPFSGKKSIWMYLNDKGDVVEIASSPIGAPQYNDEKKVVLYPR
jgi:hypothetical protein